MDSAGQRSLPAVSASGSGLSDDGAGSCRGRVAVSEVQGASLEFLDPGQGLERLIGGGVRAAGGTCAPGWPVTMWTLLTASPTNSASWSGA